MVSTMWVPTLTTPKVGTEIAVLGTAEETAEETAGETAEEAATLVDVTLVDATAVEGETVR